MNRETDTMPEDSELISRAKMGEMEAFGELYERYLDLIYRYIRCRVSDEREQEEVEEHIEAVEPEISSDPLLTPTPGYEQLERIDPGRDEQQPVEVAARAGLGYLAHDVLVVVLPGFEKQVPVFSH